MRDHEGFDHSKIAVAVKTPSSNLNADERQKLGKCLDDCLVAAGQVLGNQDSQVFGMGVLHAFSSPVIEDSESMVGITLANHDFNLVVCVQVAAVAQNG